MPGRPHTHTRPSHSGGSSPRSPGAHAHFPTIPHTISRLPHDDEKLVLRAFARHSTTCPTCNIPAGLLCTRGYARACDIEDYISVHRGRAYSVVDHKRERKRVQIEIPGDVRDEVEGLLEAMERGEVREVRAKGKAGKKAEGGSRREGDRVKRYRIEEAPRGGEYRQHARPSASAAMFAPTHTHAHMAAPVVQPAYYAYAAPAPAPMVQTGGYYYY